MPLTRNIADMSSEDVIKRYFKLIDAKDLDNLIDMFDYNAVVKEPFSKVAELKGRSEISAFLKVALMANTNMRHRLDIIKSSKAGKARARVTFEKGDELTGQFTFEVDPVTKKIKMLKIEFVT